VHNHVEAAEPVVVKSNPIVVRIDEQLTQRPDPEVVTNTDLKLFARVYFDTDQDEVKPSAQPVLTRLAGLLNDHPEITEMQIRGYADERGDAQYNLELSQRRAAAVKDFLVARGVAPQRLITVGLGEYSPAVPTGDAKGKDLKNRYEANRRVQFRILEQDGPEDGFSLN
jgi:outer membrane protein OmpA-like peptidoglycan-associated protein